ncbi:MAG: glycosyltransferase family 2 protein [Clostridia bacterium]|nr:glycosyltransferase family 2 protein [Clostridia bacterium]
MRIAAVVVTYNRLPLLRRCVERLLAQSAPCDVLLVDNASTDGTGEWAAAQEGIQYRNTGENLGGAGGFNFGMRWAVEAGYSHVWVMDDDTLPEPDALQRLLEADALLGGEYGFLSSAALWTDGSPCRMNRQKLHKDFYSGIGLLEHGLIAAVQATFVSCLFRAEVIERAGLPIREFFIWGDDIEYTRRLAVRMGLPCYIAGRSRVIHAMKENNGSSIAGDSAERIARYHYAYRNENYLYRQEGLRGFGYYTAKCGLNLVRILMHAKDRRLQRCAVIIREYVCGLAFNPRVETVRAPQAGTKE